MYLTVAEDYEFTNGTTTSSSISFEPQKAIGKGFCFNCDKPVAIEYDQWWIGDWEPPKTCRECGGHDVEFMGRVAWRLWERLGRVEWGAATDDVLAKRKGLWQRLADK